MLQFTPGWHAVGPTGKPKHHLYQAETQQNHTTDFDVIVSLTTTDCIGELHAIDFTMVLFFHLLIAIFNINTFKSHNTMQTSIKSYGHYGSILSLTYCNLQYQYFQVT